MPKLKMMKGLPGSGKSTFAKQFVKDSGNAGRINRDDLRAMVFDNVWSGKREDVIVQIEKAIAEVLLKNKLTPVIDDTNLTKKHEVLWGQFSKDFGISYSTGVVFEIEDTKTDLETCVERDSTRPKPVGKAIIHRMALDAGMIPFGEKQIILVDLDGTLCDGSHREHFLQSEKKNWYAYFLEMGNDAPIEFVIQWVKELAKDYTICIVSGRPDTYQNLTISWLDKYAVPYDYLFMRRGNDSRPDTETKFDILAKLPKEQIFFSIDDRPCIIDLWRKNGVKVIPARGECEDF
jgi:predicted kinase